MQNQAQNDFKDEECLCGACVRLICFGCGKELFILGDTNETTTHKALKQARERGWFRREFHRGAAPWFESYVCAFESEAAKRVEQYWREHQAKEGNTNGR